MEKLKLKKLLCTVLSTSMALYPLGSFAEEDLTSAQETSEPLETEESGVSGQDPDSVSETETEKLLDYRDYLLMETDVRQSLDSAAAASQTTLKISGDGLTMIRNFEECSLYAYKSGNLTQYYSIGYGHYGPEVAVDSVISQEQAENLLKNDLARSQTYLDSFLEAYSIEVSQNQYDALVSFTYSLGNIWNSDIYSSFSLKTMLINGVEQYSEPQIQEAFLEWTTFQNTKSPALVSRRQKESALFTEEMETDAEANAVSQSSGNRKLYTSSDTASSEAYVCSATLLNVRQGPGASYSSLGTITDGTLLYVTGISNGWAQFSFNGKTGYVALQYLTKVEEEIDPDQALQFAVQPEDQTVSLGETAQFHMSAIGSGLKIQWQYRKAGETEWKNSTLTGCTMDYISVKATADRNGQQYRCVVTDAAGNKIITRTVTLYIRVNQADSQQLKITSQPADFSANIGETARFSVTASGSGLSYQWQYKKGNDDWRNSTASGAKTSSMSIQTTLDRDGQQYRCKITDSAGNTVYSDVAKIILKKTELKITSQPSDVECALGSSATFSVTASGSGLSYQWQYKKGNDDWRNSTASGAKTSSMSIQTTLDRDGQQYRCKITDSAGNTIYSDAAKITLKKTELKITSQPQNCKADIGTTATFSITVSGDSLQYQWQYKKGNDDWRNSGMSGSRTSKVSVPVTLDRNNQSYRCVITDAYGNKIISSTAVLSVVKTELLISSQPSDAQGKVGSTVQFSVKASGNSLSYQWQFKNGSNPWQNSGMSGANTSTVSVPVTLARNGQQYRCIITDGYGDSVTSETASISVIKEPITISSQPADTTGVLQGTASFSIKASGGSDLVYQWQYKTTNGSWKNCTETSATSSRLTVNVESSLNGCLYRCIVSNSSGVKATSDSATLTIVKEEVKITSQPSNVTGYKGLSVTFTVKASGTGLTYKWQFKRAGSTVWSDSGMTGANTPTITVPVQADRNGQQYRCVITNSSGNSAVSNAATLSVGTISAGLHQVNGDYYYFDSTGTITKGKTVVVNQETWHFDSSTGIGLTTEQLINKYCQQVYASVGTDPWALFKWTAQFTYQTMATPYPTSYSYTYLQNYALIGFQTRKGNCMVYSATYYYLLKNLNSSRFSSIKWCPYQIRYSNGTTGAHGWVLTTESGSQYVYDPDAYYELGYTGHTFYREPRNSTTLDYIWRTSISGY